MLEVLIFCFNGLLLCVNMARIPPAKKSEDNRESAEPVYVGDFPQAVHDEQANVMRNSVPG